MSIVNEQSVTDSERTAELYFLVFTFSLQTFQFL